MIACLRKPNARLDHVYFDIYLPVRQAYSVAQTSSTAECTSSAGAVIVHESLKCTLY